MTHNQRVSIHARPRGTGDQVPERPSVNHVWVSIHARPRGTGDLFTPDAGGGVLAVSIHARPRGTGDQPGRLCRCGPGRCFNPRPPTRDGRSRAADVAREYGMFQSTPAHEGRAIRISTNACRWAKRFQSTPAHEGRAIALATSMESILQGVSIHARPRGTGDRLVSPLRPITKEFQSTPAHEGRAISCISGLSIRPKCFNPRPPTRDGRSTDSAVKSNTPFVSIHARPRGTGDR